MFSPNMLKTFQTCPYKYWLKYVEGISVPQKASFFEKGKKIHALANYYLRGDDISKLEKTLNNEEQKLWEQLKNNEYFQMSYVNSEYNLSCKVGEYWVGGRLDAVVKNNSNPSPHPSPQRGEGACHDNPSASQTFNDSIINSTPTPTLPLGEGVCHDSLTILDYKTGSIPKNPEYDFQTMVYLLCLYKNLKFKEITTQTSSARNNTDNIYCHCEKQSDVAISFVYIDLKNNKNYLIKLTPEKIEEYERAIIKICDEITNFTPQEDIEHSKKCEFCEYRKICL